MDDQSISRKTRVGGVVALVAAGAIAGGVLAGTLSASAASSPSATTSPSTSSVAPGASSVRGHGGATPARSDEKSLSAAKAATLRAAAIKAVPGGTVYRIETDAGDAAYEAHMQKADGTLVTVKFDKNLTVIRVESGMGNGDPALGQQGSSTGSSTGSAA